MTIETFIKDGKTFAFIPAAKSGDPARLLDVDAIDVLIERETRSAEAIATQKAEFITALQAVKIAVVAANAPK